MGIAGLDQILEKGLERIDAADDEQKDILLAELKARNYVPGSVEKEYMTALWAEFRKVRAERIEKLESSFQGIPREEIAWFPKVNQNKCSGCTSCVEFCIHGVFHSSEGKSHVVRPHNCVVGNTTCRSFCPEKAITFPTHAELKEMLRSLREKHGLRT
ncbi:MAG: ferredoxin family protein [Thermoplasmata archaeon]|nr:ferredoxin family protein [Thermoplasmata archaeon]